LVFIGLRRRACSLTRIQKIEDAIFAASADGRTFFCGGRGGAHENKVAQCSPLPRKNNNGNPSRITFAAFATAHGFSY